MTTENLRCNWVNSMIGMQNDDILKEFHQAMIDILDLVEQSDQEQAVIAAIEAFEKTRSIMRKKESSCIICKEHCGPGNSVKCGEARRAFPIIDRCGCTCHQSIRTRISYETT